MFNVARLVHPTAVLLALLGAFALAAGCSSSDSSPEPDPSPAPTSTATAAATEDGGTEDAAKPPVVTPPTSGGW